MVFSGYGRAEMDALRLPGVDQLLEHTDVLVSGPYDRTAPDSIRSWVGVKRHNKGATAAP